MGLTSAKCGGRFLERDTVTGAYVTIVAGDEGEISCQFEVVPEEAVVTSNGRKVLNGEMKTLIEDSLNVLDVYVSYKRQKSLYRILIKRGENLLHFLKIETQPKSSNDECQIEISIFISFGILFLMCLDKILPLRG